MALAYLTYKEALGDQIRLEADIGTNLWYQYKIGKKKRKFRGEPMVEELVHTSRWIPLPSGKLQPFQTQFILSVPKDLFRDKARYIQLVSYKDKTGRGMAVSPIVIVVPWTATFSKSLGSTHISFANMNASKNPILVKNSAYAYREPSLSESMFLGSLMGVLPGLLQTAIPVVSNLLGGLAGGGEGGGSGGDLGKLISLIANFAGQQGGNTATAQSLSNIDSPTRIKPEVLLGLAPFLAKIISPETILSIGDDSIKLLKVISDAVAKMTDQELEKLRLEVETTGGKGIAQSFGAEYKNTGYSQAQIAPALLAALPALAPIAGKLLDPKVIGAIGDQPLKIFGAVNDMFTGFDKETLAQLERINPSLANPNLLPMLLNMSASQTVKSSIPFKYEAKIDLEFLHINPIDIQGKKKAVYQIGKEIRFPIKVKTSHPHPPDRPIPKVILKVCVQDSETMKVLLEKRFKLKDVRLDSILNDIVLSPEETSSLPIGKDLKVEVAFIWKSKSKRHNLGTFKSHYVTLVGDYLFDQFQDKIGAPVPLNDIVKHRAFWHKVWEGGFSQSKRWHIEFDVKYFYTLDLEDEVPAKLETRKKKTEDNATKGEETPFRRKVRARLKSGMELTLEALNQLLPDLSQTALGMDMLEALETDAIKPYFNQVARLQVEFKGHSGDTGTLWTYPEVTVHQLQLLKMGEVNEYGQVKTSSPVSVFFPRPSSIHFIGTKSE